MKSVKGFVKTCYSEVLVSGSAFTPSDEKDEHSASEASESSYHGGLGLRFKFPGDPKKCVVAILTSSKPVLTFCIGFGKLPRSNYG